MNREQALEELKRRRIVEKWDFKTYVKNVSKVQAYYAKKRTPPKNELDAMIDFFGSPLTGSEDDEIINIDTSL